MNNLKEYIIEKLKLNKDIKVEHEIIPGDKICLINLNQPGNYRREGCPVEVLIHSPMIVEKIDEKNKKIYYIYRDKNLETEFTKINEYGFIEDNTENYITVIVLNKDDAVSFLKELYKSTKRMTLDILTSKYFEDISKLDFKYWNNEIRFYTIINSCAVNLNRKIIQGLIDEYEND